jgi:hypothetical protein
VENTVLQTRLSNREWLELAQKTFSEVFFRNGIVLSSFNKWVPHAITRFILVTQAGDSYPHLQVDADPLSIQYPTSSSILPTSSISTISMAPLITMRQLSHRNVKLVSHDGSSYVLKTIERQDELNQWRTELKTLLLLRDSPHIINVIAIVDIPDPYSPNASRVVFRIQHLQKNISLRSLTSPSCQPAWVPTIMSSRSISVILDGRTSSPVSPATL